MPVTLALVCGATWLWHQLHPAPPSVQVWRNATVLTMDRNDTRASAIAIEGDRIVAVGGDTEVEPWLARADVVLDLGGSTVVPGFIEAHGHFPGAGLGAVAADLNSPPIGNVRTVAGALDALRARSISRPGRDWLVGFGYDDTGVVERRHLRRDDLDQVSTDRPVLVMHVSGHIVSVNSVALAEYGITRSTPDRPGGEIGRNQGGAPSGVLYEHAGQSLMRDAINMALTDQLAIVRASVDAYTAQGFTTVQNGLATLDQIEALGRATQFGVVPVRVVVWPEVDVGLRLAEGSLDLGRIESDRFHVGAVKLVADGSIQGYTGHLSAPYHDTGGRGAGYAGYPTSPPEVLAAQMRQIHCAGMQVAVHGNGDQAIDSILEAWESAVAHCPADDRRPIIVHAQMARADQLEAMRRLGMTPSFFSAHVYYWGDRHRDIFLGPTRASRISPAFTALQLGVPFTTHLDTPVVPISSAMLMWAPVARETRAGDTLGASERITALDALRSITSAAAWQLHLEDQIGSIEVGKLADLTVLSDDPTTTGDLRALHVERTTVGGVTVFER